MKGDRVVWAGRELKDHPGPTLCHGQGQHFLFQVLSLAGHKVLAGHQDTSARARGEFWVELVLPLWLCTAPALIYIPPMLRSPEVGGRRAFTSVAISVAGMDTGLAGPHQPSSESFTSSKKSFQPSVWGQERRQECLHPGIKGE